MSFLEREFIYQRRFHFIVRFRAEKAAYLMPLLEQFQAFQNEMDETEEIGLLSELPEKLYYRCKIRWVETCEVRVQLRFSTWLGYHE